MTKNRHRHLDLLLFAIVSLVIFYFLSPVIYSPRFGELRVSPVYNRVSDIIFDDNDPQFDLRVIIITYKRPTSLQRLLLSLNDAEYYSDRVKVEVWIDRSKDGSIDNKTINVARNFTFKHGPYEVKTRQGHVGVQGQWMTSWKPHTNSSEIAVILEDDLTVSPFFYKYLRVVHKKYDRHPKINGYALQGYSIKHHINDNSRLEGPNNSFAFLYPVIGTWGFSPKTKNWIDFLHWFSGHYGQSSVKLFVPKNIATYWYLKFKQEGKEENMWEMWHIYYSWLKDELTLYSNFPDHAGLSTNWREVGLHYTTREGPSNKLLSEWQAEFEDLPDQPVHIDIAGHVVKN